MGNTFTSDDPDPDAKGKSDSRYRKIEVRMWSDERFRDLSPIPPSGQGLWVFLLTGPHTGPIPGLFRAGRAQMAEELNWELEAFDKAFAEVLTQGMVKADFKAKFVWLPNAVRHNKPASPNVVTSWRTELDLLPECALKREAIESIRNDLLHMGRGYVEAFDKLSAVKAKPIQKALSLPFEKPLDKTSPNQEQDQEQDKQQEQQQRKNNTGGEPPVDPSQPKKKKAAPPSEPPFVLPDWVPEKAWNGYIEMRMKTGKKPTNHACDLIVMDLQKFQKEGQDISIVLNNSTKNNWVGVFALKGGAAGTDPARSAKVNQTIQNLRDVNGGA